MHVRCLIDEAANIGQIPNLEKLMATIRSREISACLVLQAQSQLKALYKDNMDTIIGNCDSSLFLGGKEETTLKSWSALLGKETIDMYNTSVTKGTQESHGQNFQKLGKDLMSMDELAVMDGGKCLLQVRGVRPFLSRKYDITKHPNYKYLSDFNPKNTFDIEKYLSTRLRVRPDDLFLNYEISPSELAEESADDTEYYGYRVHPISGEKNYHKAVDIGMPQGTEILAGHDGVVTQAGEAGSYGLIVVLEGAMEDGRTLTTKYAHCSELLVSAGQEVKQGDVIAKVGSTGDSTGPHLHLEVLVDGQYLNPLYFTDTGDHTGTSLIPGSAGGPEIPAYPGAPMGDGDYAALITEAQKHLGKPYVFGASGPNSFDCSGFVSYVLNQSGVASVGRSTAQGLFNMSTPVSRENAQPGDLIFFTGTYSAGTPVTHVGIYIGNGQMIHAGDPVQYANINTSYWTEHFYAFGRISTN